MISILELLIIFRRGPKAANAQPTKSLWKFFVTDFVPNLVLVPCTVLMLRTLFNHVHEGIDMV